MKELRLEDSCDGYQVDKLIKNFIKPLPNLEKLTLKCFTDLDMNEVKRILDYATKNRSILELVQIEV